MSTNNWQYPQQPRYIAYPQENAIDESSGQRSLTGGWLAVSDPGYIKGFVIGAGLAYILTNQKVQRALVKGAVGVWTSLQGGFEEVKEQFQDIKSEMSMKEDE